MGSSLGLPLLPGTAGIVKSSVSFPSQEALVWNRSLELRGSSSMRPREYGP